MSLEPSPVALDLADFDALGVAASLVDTVRTRAIEQESDVAASVSAPEGWHRVVVTGRGSGHLVLSVRYDPLTTSRLHNVTGALAQRDWDLDDDGEGSTYRFPPGTDAATAAFELLAALTLGGAPRDVRTISLGNEPGSP